MKKRWIVILCFLMFLTSSCAFEKKSADAFEEWSKELPEQLLGNEEYILYSLFEDPSNANIDMEVKGLTFTSEEEYEESIKMCSSLLKELKKYDYEALNEDHKITYDVLEYTFENMIDSKDFYYLSNNYFDVSNGVQTSLPLNLYFMDIPNEDCLNAILNVMESTREVFPQYVDFEQERQNKGYGMGKTYMEEVLKQVHTFNSMDHSYLVEGISDKISSATFLDANEKTYYQKRLKEIYENDFLVAYKNLEEDLKAIKIKTKDKDASLADYEYGKAYYTSLIYDSTGFKSVKAFKNYLNKEEKRITDRLYELLDKYPSLYSILSASSMEDATYTDLSNVKDVLKYLEDKVNSENKFPQLKDVQYQMDVVPSALQEIYKAAAAYFIGPFDNLSAPEQMILNGNFEQSDYTTLAHEGFPGHMYQYRYFKGTPHNLVRDILGNGGYAEGWAVYASKEMNAYAKDAALCEYMSLNEDLVYIYIMRMDIMIHYENQSREAIYAYLRDNFNGLEEEGLKETYEQVLEDPAIFMPYYGYYLRLLNLKEDMQKQWKEDYSDYKFHKSILDLGSLPYELLEKYMEN